MRSHRGKQNTFQSYLGGNSHLQNAHSYLGSFWLQYLNNFSANERDGKEKCYKKYAINSCFLALLLKNNPIRQYKIAMSQYSVYGYINCYTNTGRFTGWFQYGNSSQPSPPPSHKQKSMWRVQERSLPSNVDPPQFPVSHHLKISITVATFILKGERGIHYLAILSGPCIYTRTFQRGEKYLTSNILLDIECTLHTSSPYSFPCSVVHINMGNCLCSKSTEVGRGTQRQIQHPRLLLLFFLKKTSYTMLITPL